MSSSPERLHRRSALRRTIVLAALLASPMAVAAPPQKLDRGLAAADGPVAVMIQLWPDAVAPTPVRGPGEPIAGFRARLVEHWRAQAGRSQAGVRAQLDAAGIPWRAYWLGNSIAATVPAQRLAALAARAEVRHIHADRGLGLVEPVPEPVVALAPAAPQAVEWGVARIRAPEVWAAGITGQGVVVAGQDTGVRWDHQALRSQYRGWDGATASHDHNWHDAIHELIGTGSNPCGLDSPVPCDDNNHGTHTVGTIVGDDGGSNQIGVAPGARWIACRNMEAGDGRPSTYTECFQWFLAPTDLAGNNPTPALAPDVINNSWGCPPAELCDPPTLLAEVVDQVRAAGIVVVASAGNTGSGCGSITAPPAMYDAAFTVGASTSAEAMAGFSSRGPVPGDVAGAIKPDVSAPGASVRSATRSGTSTYSTLSGTSMAGPHVAGVVALLIATDPNLRGDVARIEQILATTAVPLTLSQTCGGIAPATYPNHVAGHGRIDAWAAFRVAETLLVDGFD
jgi:subtilisin family serine protease